MGFRNGGEWQGLWEGRQVAVRRYFLSLGEGGLRGYLEAHQNFCMKNKQQRVYFLFLFIPREEAHGQKTMNNRSPLDSPPRKRKRKRGSNKGQLRVERHLDTVDGVCKRYYCMSLPYNDMVSLSIVF